MSVRLLTGDCRDVLKRLLAGSVHCLVTSPPYYRLRDYGVDGQIGLEASPSEYIEKLVEVFREVRRVLRSDGTCWVCLGDSYAGSWGNQGRKESRGTQRPTVNDGRYPALGSCTGTIRSPGLKPKDLIGIPWMIAFALRADGWYLRQDIIWSKPNPMPESVTDRCTKAHEYVFLLSKSPRYYYDAEAIAEEMAPASITQLSQPTLAMQTGSARVPGKTNGPMKAVGSLHMQGTQRNDGERWRIADGGVAPRGTRNRRSVWTVATAPFPEGHFATFPPDLVEPCILAGTSAKGVCAECGAPWARVVERQRYATRPGNPIKADTSRNDGGRADRVRSDVRTTGWQPSCSCNAAVVPATVLDPFAGAGTTALVADRLGRDAIGIELNPSYRSMAHARIADDAGLFAQVAAE